MRLAAIPVIAVLVAGMCVTPASAIVAQDGFPNQTSLDSEWWSHLDPGGVAARPFVKHLSVIRGGVETVVIDNPEGQPIPVAEGGFDVAITPYNMCRADQTPAPGVCYAIPNRVDVQIGYVVEGNLHNDFSSDLAAGFGVDQSTEFDLTLGLNTLGQTLRWSWMPGLPTYWQVSGIGQPDASLHVRFKPRALPFTTNGGGCTQIPVSATCEFTAASRNRTQANILLSLDQTLDPAFTGALFGTDKGYIGSLDATRDSMGNPALTWGIAAPVTVDGLPNAPRLWAVVSDAALLNYFGVPPEGDPRTLFAVSVDSGSGDPDTGGWQRWASADRGTDGWLISTNPVAVVSEVAAGFTRSALPRTRVAKAITVSMKRKAAPPQVIARYSSATKRTSVSFNGSRTLRGKCVEKGYTCRVRVERLRSQVSLGRTEVANVAVALTSTAITASATTAKSGAPNRSRVIAILERRGSVGGWKYLASAGTTVGT